MSSYKYLIMMMTSKYRLWCMQMYLDIWTLIQIKCAHLCGYGYRLIPCWGRVSWGGRRNCNEHGFRHKGNGFGTDGSPKQFPETGIDPLLTFEGSILGTKVTVSAWMGLPNNFLKREWTLLGGQFWAENRGNPSPGSAKFKKVSAPDSCS